MRTYVKPGLLLAILAVVLQVGDALGASPGSTVRVSVSTDGLEGNGDSQRPEMSPDGRYVAFDSVASNLVSGDTNGVSDVFVRDRDTDGDAILDESGAVATERVSVSSAEAESNGASVEPDISTDGRYVAFDSLATNLVDGDTNSVADILVRDRVAGTTVRVSLSSADAQANGGSFSGRISGDGRFVAFCSNASNLVSGDANWTTDAFVHDRDADVDGIFDESGAVATERVSVSSAEAEGNGRSCENSDLDISANGRYVTFPSVATNLVDGDTNGRNDVFVHDRQTGTTERVSVSTAGVQGNGTSAWPNIDDDGRFVVFSSTANNLVTGDTNATWDIFLRDRQTGTTERVSLGQNPACNQANANSGYASVSDDGGYVAFFSYAVNLVSGDTNGIGDFFLRDRLAGTTQRVSVDSAGNQGVGPNVELGETSISADGLYVVFYSRASNLVSGDNNSALDVFVHERGSAGPVPPCATPTVPGAAVGGIAELPEISDSSTRNDAALAAGLAAAVVALTAGGWYARRRWSR